MSFGDRRLQQGSEVTAEGGLGRFDVLPGDIQIKIWNMAHQIYVDAATLIQSTYRRLRMLTTRIPWQLPAFDRVHWSDSDRVKRWKELKGPRTAWRVQRAYLRRGPLLRLPERAGLSWTED